MAKKTTNVHVVETTSDVQQVLLISDAHLDNAKCQRGLLKQHLDEAVRRGARIAFNGDTLDLMQAKDDPRASKSALRVEHKAAAYFDQVINEAAEFLRPWAHQIVFIGRGNHEQAVLSKHETDPTARLVERLNLLTGSRIECGGYGGWLVLRFTGENRTSWKLKYFHGTGGGGPATRGMPDFQKLMAMTEGADAVWQGHVHESTEAIAMVEHLRHDFTPAIKPVLFIRTSTYKEEYVGGHSGWHVERMAPPKPLGGRWLTVERRRDRERGLHVVARTVHAD